jgi:hypothetical protein
MLHGMLFGVAVALALLGSSLYRFWLVQRASPSVVSRASFPTIFAAMPVVFGAVLAARSTWGLVQERDTVWAILFLAGFIVLLLFLPLLFRSEVSVANGYLTGPARTFGPFIWFNRNSIRLADIEAVGTTRTGYTYYQARDGSRVYVSTGYPGSSAFIAALNEARSNAP